MQENLVLESVEESFIKTEESVELMNFLKNGLSTIESSIIIDTFYNNMDLSIWSERNNLSTVIAEDIEKSAMTKIRKYYEEILS